jgi:hypothetical protein
MFSLIIDLMIMFINLVLMIYAAWDHEIDLIFMSFIALVGYLRLVMMQLSK